MGKNNNTIALKQKDKELPWYMIFACGGIAACHAEFWSLPLDTAKVRMQLQTKDIKYKNLLHCIKLMSKEEGPAALWKGLIPGLLRQLTFASLRIGFYDQIGKKMHKGPGPPSLLKKIQIGLVSGAIAITIANPVDLVKIRLQADGAAKGSVKRYNGTVDAIRKILKNEGVLGLWKGVGPNILRNSTINAAELASYFQIKEAAIERGFSEGVPLHLACGFGAGIFGTLTGSPFDVTKTRIMNQKIVDGKGIYKNLGHCMWTTLKTEGPLAFYKGFIPNVSRIASWNMIMFLSLEQIKSKMIDYNNNKPEEKQHKI